MEFSAHVLNHAPWSHSKFGSVEKCQLQYYKRYVEKQREHGSSAESKVGVAVHYVSEHVVKHDMAPTSTLLDEAVRLGKLTSSEVDSMMTFMPKVEKFADWLRNFIHKYGVKETLIEEQMGINLRFEPTSFSPGDEWTEEELLVPWESTPRDPERPPLKYYTGDRLRQAVLDGLAPVMRGVLDLGLLTANNDMVIIDHKTGKHKNIADHGPQLNIYRLFAVARYNVRSVQCAIHYAETGRIDWTPPMTREQIIRQLQPWLYHYLNKQHYKLKLIDEGKEAPPDEIGWWCSWCGFVRDCPPGLAEATRRRDEKIKKGLPVKGVSI